MSKYVFDIEANGLLHQCTKFWIAVFIDIKTEEEIIFSDAELKRLKTTGGHDPRVRPESELIPFLDDAEELIGHHILGYDLLAIHKLKGWEPRWGQRLVDTVIYSQVLNYKRFGFGHGLAKWGDFFEQPKPEHEDWNNYSYEMKKRCIEDTRINLRTFRYLVRELNKRKSKDKLKIGIAAEHAAARWVGLANYHGWPFDKETAVDLHQKIGVELEGIKKEIEPKLRLIIKNVDQKDDVKSPAYLKTGAYAKRTADWFGIDAIEGRKEELWERPIWGDYCRVEPIKPEIGNLDAVKDYLYSLGWEPQEFNFKRLPTGKMIKTGPKLDEDSVSKLGKEGEMVLRYFSVRARYSTLTTWLEENLTSKNRVHGDCFVIGTPTFRSRHEIIANLPSESAVYGKEIRSLFIAKPGWKVIGADSSGNQARALCHYLDNEEYTNKVISGDIHTVNKELLENQLGSLGEDARGKAKRFLYAILFGGGFGKLGLILTGRRDIEAGKKVKKGFLESIPGLKRLNRWLDEWYTTTANKSKRGAYIQGLDTRPVYCSSDHKALNYLLQSAEKITCSLAIQWLMEKLEEENIPYQPLIFYHDEVEFMVPDAYTKRAAELAALAFREGPKRIGVTIMDGESKIGDNWYEVH